MEMYTMSRDDMERFANLVREIYVEWLVRHKHLTEDVANELNRTTSVISARPSVLGRLMAKLCGKKAETMRVVIAKLDMYFDEEAEEKPE